MNTAESLAKLLASFEPSVLNTGSYFLNARHTEHQRPVFLSRVPAFDQLNGGLPRGSLVEITGNGSSGKFSLEIALLAAATSSGENAALIDWGDHFDPTGAQDAGVQLEHVFWVRPMKFTDALKSTEIVLNAGFRMVMLDLGIKPMRLAPTNDAAWRRIARETKTHDSIAFVFSPHRIASTAADLCIETSALASHWTNPTSSWQLLEGLSVQMKMIRQRGAALTRPKRLSLAVRPNT